MRYLNIKKRYFSLILLIFRPFYDGFPVLTEINREPDVTCVDRVFRPPYICHEDMLSVGHGENVCALSAECYLRIGPYAWRGVLCPWAEDGGCGEHTCLVGVPSRASRCYHPVCPVVLEYGGRLVLPSWCDTCVASCVPCVVTVQLGYVYGEVLL